MYWCINSYAQAHWKKIDTLIEEKRSLAENLIDADGSVAVLFTEMNNEQAFRAFENGIGIYHESSSDFISLFPEQVKEK